MTNKKFALIVLANTYHFRVSHYLGLKTEDKCFFDNQIPMAKISGKSAIWTIFSFSVSSPNYTNWEFMFLMQQSHVKWRILSDFLCNSQNLALPEKRLKNKDFPHLPRYLSHLFGFQKLLRLIYFEVTSKHMPSIWFRNSNSKISHINFCLFLRQSVA